MFKNLENNFDSPTESLNASSSANEVEDATAHNNSIATTDLLTLLLEAIILLEGASLIGGCCLHITQLMEF